MKADDVEVLKAIGVWKMKLASEGKAVFPGEEEEEDALATAVIEGERKLMDNGARAK